jgi:hypothetical protein
MPVFLAPDQPISITAYFITNNHSQIAGFAQFSSVK